MTLPRIAESAGRRIEPSPLGSDGFEIDRPVITAMVMLDVLVAIKMDLTKVAPPEISGAEELQHRVDRACNTIEVVIQDLKRITGVSCVNADGEPARTWSGVKATLRELL
jgi:hypothetical protein